MERVVWEEVEVVGQEGGMGREGAVGSEVS